MLLQPKSGADATLTGILLSRNLRSTEGRDCRMIGEHANRFLNEDRQVLWRAGRAEQPVVEGAEWLIVVPSWGKVVQGHGAEWSEI